jgi:hypothetical protein
MRRQTIQRDPLISYRGVGLTEAVACCLLASSLGQSLHNGQMGYQRKQDSEYDAPFLLARARISAGLLPVSRGVGTATTGGDGADCVLCESVINHGSKHLVLQWIDAPADDRTAALHPMCHGVWYVIAKKVPQTPGYKPLSRR